MEDRYLFKAKRLDNGEWVTGQYVNTCYPKDCKKQDILLLNIRTTLTKSIHLLSANAQA